MRKYRKWSSVSSRGVRETGRQLLAALDRKSVLESLQEGLHNLAVEIGRVVAVGLLEDEAARLCGERYVHNTARVATRHGGQRGWVVVAGQKVPLDRPRVRSAGGGEEVPLDRYRQLQCTENLREAVLRRVVHGASERNYEQVVERVRQGFGMKRSSVSRTFVLAMADKIKGLCERRWDKVRFVAIMIDGKSYAREMMVVALGIVADGTKHILGLRQGATENAQVCKELLASLRERGVATDVPTLFVLDGSKALSAAVVSVWGENALVQRCQIHKRRNVKEHLAKGYWPELDRRLAEAYGETDYDRALALLKRTASWLAGINPDAAASLREGLEETLTVVRLGVHADLRKTLSNTNVIESAFSVAGQVSRQVKRWRPGDMRWRWCAAGLLHAEERFRRVDGYRHIGALLAVIERTAPNAAVDAAGKVV
ncbi:MAG: transposase [Chloroflexota bacterium]|nr:transposase [Chloroflexota bacterium]